ncbi:MAG: winged-helix domain-containing protein, partial [Parabacteroides sp.]|nr:winged-helix domain-containing protein [Parabacteroides sp.]
MTNDEIKQLWKVPEPTLRRLPWYLAFLKLMKGRGELFVSSTQIAKEINKSHSTVLREIDRNKIYYKPSNWNNCYNDKCKDYSCNK